MFLRKNNLQTSKALYGLSELQEHSSIDTGIVWHTGKQGNMRIKVQSSGITANGSLAKYYLGNNLESLTRKTTEQAFEKMSDVFHLPMQEAMVYRIDVAQNIVVNEPVEHYLLQLGEARYFERQSIKKNGLLYTRYNGALSFYDKIAELKMRKEKIPEVFQGRNVLRYERKWTRRLPKQFHITSISGSTLFQKDFYVLCLEKWKQDFILIHKKQLPTNEVTMNGIKDFMTTLAFLGVQKYGERNLAETIKAKQKSGKISKKTASDLKNKLKEITEINMRDLDGYYTMREIEIKIAQAIIDNQS